MGVGQAVPFDDGSMEPPWVYGPVASRPAGVRVVALHPTLPLYRIPVFRALAERPGVELKVLYGQAGVIPNVPPDGFDAENVDRHVLTLGGHQLWWSNSQWESAGSPDFDLLLLNWNLHYASLIPALLRAKHHGKATILWGHGYSKHDNFLRRWPREKVADLATALLLYNHSTARHFIEQGHDPRRVFVALNALDQRPIQAARDAWLDQPEKLRAFRESHDLIDRPIVLFVSRLDPDNRLELLIHATARLVRHHPRIHTVIIGEGVDQPRLRTLARRLNVASRIRFLGAIYNEIDLAPWFLCANAFCYPANMGLSVMHAFGYGLPVVTGNHVPSHNPEIEALQHGVNGLLFQHGRVTSLTDALHPLIVDRAFHAKLSAAARETALRRFTLNGMIDGMMNAIVYAAQFIRR